ncbi:MAG: hypothetical protein NUV53_04640 [Patescibacteria group bacterium]|nr:hypothetical protein [Patescibacteria group bacterium]
MKKSHILFSFILLLSLAFFSHASTINTTIPGTNPTASNPAGFVANFYQFSLMLGGLLAFGAIVYGAITYTISAGNPEMQRDGKDRITQALIGLALLMGAVLIINFINPDIITHPNRTTFILKDINTQGLKDNTSENPLQYDPSSAVNYNELHEQMVAAREEYQKLEDQVITLRQEAAYLEEDALYDPAAKAQVDEFNRQADVLEQQLTGKKAETNSTIYKLRADTAALSNDAEQIKFLKEANDQQLDSAIAKAKAGDDVQTANALVIRQYTDGLNLTQKAALAAIAQTNKTHSARDLGDVYSAITSLETGSGKIKLEALKKAHPDKAEEIQKTADDTIKAIRAAYDGIDVEGLLP